MCHRGEIFRAQSGLHPTCACKEYLQHSPALFSACGYRYINWYIKVWASVKFCMTTCREDNIPQLEDVSNYLKAKTDWQLWPVVGWISPRDFLACLAFRCFPTSQYIRHRSSPFYTPEPYVTIYGKPHCGIAPWPLCVEDQNSTLYLITIVTCVMSWWDMFLFSVTRALHSSHRWLHTLLLPGLLSVLKSYHNYVTAGDWSCLSGSTWWMDWKACYCK